MALPVSGKTYRFKCAGASTRYLNLYSSGTASDGMNVVLYTGDSSNEQIWKYSGSKLLSVTNTGFALDKYTLAGNANNNNADIWTANDPANQNITFESVSGNTVKIKLSGSAHYLTAYSNANGTGTGKTPTSAGNVYWASSSSSTMQRWTFEEVAGGVEPSGDYYWPTESRTVVRWSGSDHDGADIAPKVHQITGDKVYSYMDGYVAMVGTPTSNANEGFTVRIHHTNPLNNGYTNIRTQYMHLKSSALVQPYQFVRGGTLIGYMGNTGNVIPAPTPSAPGAGTHLHFEVRGGTTAEFPLGGSSSNGFYTGTVLPAKNYCDLT